MELPLRFGEQRRDVDRLGERAGHAQQRRDIVDIRIDAVAHPGILHLDRQIAPVGGPRAVDLADRRRGERPGIEAREPAPPILAPIARKHLLELRWRHVMRIVAQPREDLRQLGREEIARVHRNHLPQLHRRAAQVGELIGDAPDIGGGEQQVAHLRPLAIGDPTRALRQHAARDTAGQPPEHPEPRDAPAGNGFSARIAIVGHADAFTKIGCPVRP